MSIKMVTIYLREQYIHEANYENYQMDMLYGIFRTFAGKEANVPRYCELHEKTNQSSNDLNGKEILNELINAW